MPKTKKAAVTKGSMRPGAPAKGAAAKAGAKDGWETKRSQRRGCVLWRLGKAKKHAGQEGVRAMVAERSLPGSARDDPHPHRRGKMIGNRAEDLHAALAQIKGYRKNLNKTFFDIGVVLKDIQTRRLYEAKRFPSFEAFVEREIDLGKTTSMRLVRVASLFQKEGALELGMERLFTAIQAIDTIGTESENNPRIPPPPTSTQALPAPLHTGRWTCSNRSRDSRTGFRTSVREDRRTVRSPLV